MKKIDSCIIGVHKCASTSLFKLLSQHDEIMSHTENQLDDFLQKEDYKVRYREIESSLVIEANDAKHILIRRNDLYGDLSSLKRLHNLNPSIKLIIILREPVARAISAFFYSKRNGHIENSISFNKIIERWDEGTEAQESLMLNRFIKSGMYSSLLDDIVNIFPIDQLCILTTEELLKDANLVASKTFDFLGLSDQLVKVVLSNQAYTVRFPLLKNILLKPNVCKTFFSFVVPKNTRTKILHTLLPLFKKESKKAEVSIESMDRLKEIYSHSLLELEKKYDVKF